MAKILILANNDVGLYKFRKELLTELVKEHDVYISLPNGSYVSQLKDIGCKFFDTAISRRGTNPLTDIRLLLSYRKIIKKIKPDVVLTYTIKPNIYGGMACRITKTPYISNITGLGTALENGGILQKITLNLYRIALYKASCIFIQNEENKRFLNRKKVINGKSTLIPGSGVNIDEYSLLSYPENGEKVNFLYIARIMKEKGIEEYLEAAEYIKEKHPSTSFHILGYCEQNYKEKLEEMSRRGVIQYHGMQKDTRKYHAISHCTIHPTFYPEGMSNVLLESSSCGRPIITTKRSGCKEIVDEGINGYFVEQKQSQDLIKKIEEFLRLDNKEREKMGLNGREKMEKEFNREIIVNKYTTEITNVLSKIK